MTGLGGLKNFPLIQKCSFLSSLKLVEHIAVEENEKQHVRVACEPKLLVRVFGSFAQSAVSFVVLGQRLKTAHLRS